MTTRTIRYYEELGLLGAVGEPRRRARHRLYTESDILRLRELIRLRDLLGLSLEELSMLAEAEEARAALRDRWSGTDSDAERLRIVEEATIRMVQRQLDLLRSRRATLDELAEGARGQARAARRAARRDPGPRHGLTRLRPLGRKGRWPPVPQVRSRLSGSCRSQR